MNKFHSCLDIENILLAMLLTVFVKLYCDRSHNEKNLISISYFSALLLYEIICTNEIQVLSAHIQPFPLLANPVLSCQAPWNASMNETPAAAAIVAKTSPFPVSMAIQPMVLESGLWGPLYALQRAVTARVSGDENVFTDFVL